MAQVFALGRHVIIKKTGKERVEVVYGVPSLRPEQADPGRLLELVRSHWRMENTSPWVRDVTCDADRSQVRSGNIPQRMAALRNTAIGLRRWGAIRTSRRPAAGWLPSRPRHWRSSVLNSKTKWPWA